MDKHGEYLDKILNTVDKMINIADGKWTIETKLFLCNQSGITTGPFKSLDVIDSYIDSLSYSLHYSHIQKVTITRDENKKIVDYKMTIVRWFYPLG